jgi:hypothetical protein
MSETKTQYLVDEKGDKTAVVIPWEEYQEMLEDMHDLVVIAERKDEPTVPFEDVIKRLSKWSTANRHNL